ncbi:MAG TPA: lipid-binding SYLF domain-containing protein [Thermodesulfovibrionales bacterium]|jgi:lipid-binding SYLF domain-containing protein|nr:lipid-binding SYLF domain-containing protein [Thermodesulfovibrionales bacterium]
MEKRRSLSSNIIGMVITFAMLLTMGIAGLGIVPAAADDALDSKHLVEKAKITFDKFVSKKDNQSFRDLLKKAKGIFIAPQILKGAFIVGASGGSGVLVARDEKSGKWAGPAFYTIGSASFGLQIGGEASEVILLAMTERGVTSLLGSSVKLGADVSIAAGPLGAGASAATANLSADILSFAYAKGAFAGISLDGAIVEVRDGLNKGYYGKKVDPKDILIKQDVKNPHARGLLNAVSKAAGGK